MGCEVIGVGIGGIRVNVGVGGTSVAVGGKGVSVGVGSGVTAGTAVVGAQAITTRAIMGRTRNTSVVIPLATRLKIKATVMRMPLMHALPPMMFGSKVMRSKPNIIIPPPQGHLSYLAIS